MPGLGLETRAVHRPPGGWAAALDHQRAVVEHRLELVGHERGRREVRAEELLIGGERRRIGQEPVQELVQGELGQLVQCLGAPLVLARVDAPHVVGDLRRNVDAVRLDQPVRTRRIGL